MKTFNQINTILLLLLSLNTFMACDIDPTLLGQTTTTKEQYLTIEKIDNTQQSDGNGSPTIEPTDQTTGFLPSNECGAVQCPYGGEINHHSYLERFEAEDLGSRIGIEKDNAWFLWASGAPIQKKVNLRAGHYVFRVKAWAEQAGDETAQMLVVVNKEAKIVDVTGDKNNPELFYWEYDMPEGEATMKAYFMNDLYDETQDRNLIVDYFEVEALYTCYYVNEALSADCPYGGNMEESAQESYYEAEDLDSDVGQALDTTYALYTEGTIGIDLSLERGRHEINIRAFADRAGDEFAKMQVSIGDYVKNFDVDNVEEIPGNFIMDVDLPQGDYTLNISFINDFNDESNQYDEIELYGRDRNLYVDQIVVKTEYQCVTVDPRNGGGLHL